MLNEDSPRYNFRTDFVNVSAASSLTITIYDNPGFMDSLTSLKVPFLQKVRAPGGGGFWGGGRGGECGAAARYPCQGSGDGGSGCGGGTIWRSCRHESAGV